MLFKLAKIVVDVYRVDLLFQFQLIELNLYFCFLPDHVQIHIVGASSHTPMPGESLLHGILAEAVGLHFLDSLLQKVRYNLRGAVG